MRINPIRRKSAGQTTRPVAGKAKAAASTANLAGLHGFAINVSDALGKAAFAKVAKSRAALRSLAGASAASFKKLDPEAAALDHLDQALASDAMKKFNRPTIETAASEFKSLGSEASPLTGSTVVKFRQMFNKIPVYGSLVTVEIDKNNACLGINSSLGSPIGVAHVAKVSPAAALATVAKAAGLRAAAMTQTPRLYYYFDQHASQWRLAYIIENVTPARAKSKSKQSSGTDARLKDYVVDGHSAKLLAELPRIATMATAVEAVKDANNKRRKITVEVAPGNKRMLRDTELNVTTYGFSYKDPSAQSSLLPGQLYQKPPTPWPLEAIGAHANGAEVARFLRKIVLRNNLDNRGGEMVSTVNCWDRGDGKVPARQWKNAYWNGKQMVYGQIKFPDDSFYSIASMLDVVAHEMFHGVTDFTSRLEYRTQPGALNESYSDIFGVIISNFSKPLSKWVWEIGRGFDGPGTALRNLADPALHDQPKHMRNYRSATPPYTYERNDYGWVHDNSGIHNYAAYKVMTAQDRGEYVFTKRAVAAMFFVALTVHLSRTSQFSDSRRAVVQAANSLFRSDSPRALRTKIKAVEEGFAAAGIV